MLPHTSETYDSLQDPHLHPLPDSTLPLIPSLIPSIPTIPLPIRFPPPLSGRIDREVPQPPPSLLGRIDREVPQPQAGVPLGSEAGRGAHPAPLGLVPRRGERHGHEAEQVMRVDRASVTGG